MKSAENGAHSLSGAAAAVFALMAGSISSYNFYLCLSRVLGILYKHVAWAQQIINRVLLNHTEAGSFAKARGTQCLFFPKSRQ